MLAFLLLTTDQWSGVTHIIVIGFAFVTISSGILLFGTLAVLSW